MRLYVADDKDTLRKIVAKYKADLQASLERNSHIKDPDTDISGMLVQIPPHAAAGSAIGAFSFCPVQSYEAEALGVLHQTCRRRKSRVRNLPDGKEPGYLGNESVRPDTWRSRTLCGFQLRPSFYGRHESDSHDGRFSHTHR